MAGSLSPVLGCVALAIMLPAPLHAAIPANVSAVVPVCVVGNGPAALAASALLSGHWPFYGPQPHPHAPLHEAIDTERTRVAAATGRLAEAVSLLELDLAPALRVVGLMEGGRSNNPWALLVDALLHPDADGMKGAADYTCIEVRHLPARSIEHVVIGRGPAGGSWNRMAPGTVTLSPGYWMALPGLTMAEAGATPGADLTPHALARRIERGVVAEYYQAYARKFLHATAAVSKPLPLRGGGLLIDAEVTAVEEASDGSATPDSETCEGDSRGEAQRGPERRSWRVSYRSTRAGGPTGEESSLQAQVVALACGMADRPKRLEDCELPGDTDTERGAETERGSETAVEILHRAPHTWSWNPTSNRQRGRVLLVGAGLSAADALVAALRSEHRLSLSLSLSHTHRNTHTHTHTHTACAHTGGLWDIVHVFRGAAQTTKIVSKFGQRPNGMYPEYYELAQLMQRRTQLKPHYEPKRSYLSPSFSLSLSPSLSLSL